jgi:hypothetical protein
MSIAILGGLDRLKRNYETIGKELGFQVKIFSQRVPNMDKRLNGVKAIVLFTGSISHPMMQLVRKSAKLHSIPIERSHSSSLSSLKRCLNSFALS